MNVTGEPWQDGLVEAAIVMLAGELGLTTIVTGVEVAGLLVAHISLDLSLQVTTSPSVGVQV